jgi:hypothetical protein
MLDDFIDNYAAVDSWDWRLARSVHVSDDHPVGVVEGAAEFVRQRFGSRKTVRLKHRNETPPADRFSCAKCGTDFGGMMRVIVHEQKTVARVFDFKPPARVLEFPK